MIYRVLVLLALSLSPAVSFADTLGQIYDRCYAGNSSSCRRFVSVNRDGCDNGRDDYCVVLGELFQSGFAQLSQSYDQALYYFSKACRMGNGNGCYGAGVLVAEELAQSSDEAVYFFRRGCTAQQADSCNNLAVHYYRNSRLREALDMFGQACRLGSELGCRNQQRIR